MTLKITVKNSLGDIRSNKIFFRHQNLKKVYLKNLGIKITVCVATVSFVKKITVQISVKFSFVKKMKEFFFGKIQRIKVNGFYDLYDLQLHLQWIKLVENNGKSFPRSFRVKNFLFSIKKIKKISFKEFVKKTVFLMNLAMKITVYDLQNNGKNPL